MSRNSLRSVPDEIDKMRALRVFAIQHNSIQDLPICLGNITTLRMLKLAGNPFNSRLSGLLGGHDETLSPTTPALPNDENEKDKILTRRVIEYLRSQAAARGHTEELDAPMETPRAQSRFPIQPLKYSHSTSGSESASASDARSPNFMKATVPSRSHFRGPSFQTNTAQGPITAFRRPSLAPLALGNERNRSNSESVLQATQQPKNKRMGMVTKKQSDLAALDEYRSNRSSLHLRGQSHGSALRHGYRPGDSTNADVTSTQSYRDGTFVRRLSSIPEQKQQSTATDKIVEGAKGILYSIHLIHPQILTLMTLIKDPKAKRSSLQRIYQDASLHLDHLDQEIHRFDNTQRHSKRFDHATKRSICRASDACVTAYQDVGGILLRNANQIIQDGDPRYIRTLLLMLYGTLNEARNARQVLSRNIQQIQSPPATSHHIPALKKISQQAEAADRGNSITPTQDRPRPDKSWRNGSIGRQVLPNGMLSSQSSQTSIPSYLSGRSRSNSRAGGVYSSTAASSIASTPRSGESFGSNLLVPRSRSGSIAKSPERAYQAQLERDQFERIFLTLSKAADQGLQVIPHLEPRFVSKLEIAKRSYSSPQVRDLWTTLVNRTRFCMETSEALRARLANIKLNDLEARNAPDFWRLAKKFVNSYGNLLVSLREARLHQMVDNDVKHMLRPVHKTTVDAANLMNESPWNRLTSTSEEYASDVSSPPQSTIHSRAPTPVLHTTTLPSLHIPLPHPPPPTPVAMQAPSRSQSQSRNDPGLHRRTAGTKGSSGSNNGVASPASYNASIPATPLSAALGPAAQATLSSTSSGPPGLNKSFEGDVFQRADYLQSTMRRVG